MIPARTLQLQNSAIGRPLQFRRQDRQQPRRNSRPTKPLAPDTRTEPHGQATSHQESRDFPIQRSIGLAQDRT